MPTRIDQHKVRRVIHRVGLRRGPGHFAKRDIELRRDFCQRRMLTTHAAELRIKKLTHSFRRADVSRSGSTLTNTICTGAAMR